MELKINPLDPLFFRNGRPFTAGEETWAESVFPPNPSVLYGALRTVLSTVPGKEIDFNEIKIKLGSAAVKVKGLYYLLDGTPYYPLPLDYNYNKDTDAEEQKVDKENKSYKLYLAKARSRKAIISSEKSQFQELIFESFDRSETFADGIITESALLDYLRNESPEILARRLRDFTCEEPKVGIGRDDSTRSVNEGMLFRVGMQRLKNLQLGMSVGDIPNYNAADLHQCQVRLGGEGRIVSISSSIRSDFDQNLKNIKLKQGYFKLYFATPAIINNATFLPQLGKKATLLGAIMGKPVSVGGYDMVLNQPKTMYKTIPAGSVFYYQTEEAPEEIAALQGLSFSDERKEEGFGIAYFGNFTPQLK